MNEAYHPYDRPNGLNVEDLAAQIRHLAIVGLASTDTTYNVKDMNPCLVSLFEVIARLAYEIECAEASS